MRYDVDTFPSYTYEGLEGSQLVKLALGYQWKRHMTWSKLSTVGSATMYRTRQGFRTDLLRCWNSSILEALDMFRRKGHDSELLNLKRLAIVVCDLEANARTTREAEEGNHLSIYMRS